MMSSDSVPSVREHLRAHALSLPEVWEDHPFGNFPVFKRGKKMFAWIGESGLTLSLKATPTRQAELIFDPAITAASYLGRHGWVAIDLTADGIQPVAEELLEEAHALLAPKQKSTKLKP